MFVADLPHLTQVVGLQGPHAAFALDGLQQYCDHVRVVGGYLAQRLRIVAGCPDEPRDQGLESRLNLAIAGSAQGGQGATVKGAVQYDNGGLFDAAPVAVQTGELDRCFVGLGTGIAEETGLHAGYVRQGCGQLFLALDTIEVRCVDQLVCLFADSAGYRRMGVPESVDGDA